MSSTVKLGCVALDCPDPYRLAGFYGALLGWKIHDEHKPGDDWVTLVNPDGGADISFQSDPDYRPSTWPANERPQMLHLDFTVPDIDAEHDRVLGLGATLLDDGPATFRVYADPDGHPFCLCAC
ncbi:VOC family protein [Prauserella cavernicola]|uniref:VOC family protein n=1 Tax=Prauserella cavernicola TaxID=2800127 RepID=A0A934QRA5_9PSEU|nr:VOC family protein [Prauserella cavernicola]MBK1784249.1 VOC family protein [Prauserella cavernicola]